MSEVEGNGREYKTTVSGRMDTAGDFSVIVDPNFGNDLRIMMIKELLWKSE